jgi:hypothetical protein
MAEWKVVPRKHAEIIKAWADGSQIQYYDGICDMWIDLDDPEWLENQSYRVKPEVVKPEWPKTAMTDCQLYDAYENNYGYYERLSAVANRAIAHALETSLVVLPETTVKPAQIDYKKDAEAWGGALNEAAWEFIENSPEKSALLFNTCKTTLRAAILKYLERVDGSAL